MVNKIMYKNITNNNVNYLKTVRNYFHGIDNVSYRRFKKALDKLIELEDPEGLVIGAGMPNRRMSWEELEERQERLLIQAVEKEFVPAMVALAEYYYDKGSYKKAFELYERAAELNDAYAMKVLAYSYRGGFDGLKKNEKKAKALMEKSKHGINWSKSKGFDAERSDYD